MELFKMGGHDFTSNIVMSTYKINSEPVYEEWKDSNSTVHREFLRDQIKGSFTLKFYTIADYELFINLYKSNTSGNLSTEATLYLNNSRKVSRSYFFMEFTPENNLPILGMKDDKGFEVTITER